MCCGRFNQQAVKVSRPEPDAPAQRLGVQPGNARVARMGSTPIPQFEYVGKTALTVVSPISGRHYRFARTGARLEVDVRDRSWLAFVPNLKRAD